MEVTLRNCAGGKTYYVRDGRLAEGEGGEEVDCKGLPLKRLTCTIALNPLEPEEPPPPEFVDSLLLGGVGSVIAPPGTSAALVKVVNKPFALDPMLPPEELPEGGVVARAVTPESTYGYKEKYGEWPIRHMGEKAKSNIILNPFWVTTWEVKLIKYPAFAPELPARTGVASPVPPELLKALYVPLEPFEGPERLVEYTTKLVRTYFWNPRLRAEHDESVCKAFGCEAEGFWVGTDRAEVIVLKDKIVFDEDMYDLYDALKEFFTTR